MSCSSSELIEINPKIELRVNDGIEAERAQQIVSQFLESEKRWNIRGVVEIEYFEEEYKKQCNEHPMALQEHGKFCNAIYTISHSSDPYCVGGSRVIESCTGGECSYEISKYIEICE